MAMASDAPDEDEIRAQRFDPVVVERLWVGYRAGDRTPCPIDGWNLALSVDGSTKSYRFVCCRCGHASQWFMSSSDGVVFRAMDPREMLANDDEDDD